MSAVKLIYFEGCPNSKHARAVLLSSGVEFDAIIQDTLPQDDPYKQYSSPTILKGDEVVFGSRLRKQSSACSFQKIDETEIRTKLVGGGTQSSKKGRMASIGSFGSALTVGLCPICIPAIGAFLSSIGLGFLTTETVLKPVLIVFITLALLGFLWSYLREHKNIGPLAVGVLMSIALYTGRYVYIGGTINFILMYGGIAGIVGVSIWNLFLRKRASCSSCRSEV